MECDVIIYMAPKVEARGVKALAIGSVPILLLPFFFSFAVSSVCVRVNSRVRGII